VDLRRQAAAGTADGLVLAVFFCRINCPSFAVVVAYNQRWAFDNVAFKGALAHEAADIGDKARRIRICKRRPERWLVDYQYEDTGRFLGFAFVKACDALYQGKGHRHSEWLDFGCIRANTVYAKGGGRNATLSVRKMYFLLSRLSQVLPSCERRPGFKFA
jgi:hypothetical protein